MKNRNNRQNINDEEIYETFWEENFFPMFNNTVAMANSANHREGIISATLKIKSIAHQITKNLQS